jgi:hypothetical protein
MPLLKVSAKGLTIKHGSAATPTTLLTGVESLGINLGDVELIEVTTHESTQREYVDGGLRDTPEIPITLTYDSADTGHEAIRAAHAARTLYYLTFVEPGAGAAQWACSGYFTRAEIPKSGVREALKLELNFKVKSAETFTQ